MSYRVINAPFFQCKILLILKILHCILLRSKKVQGSFYALFEDRILLILKAMYYVPCSKSQFKFFILKICVRKTEIAVILLSFITKSKIGFSTKLISTNVTSLLRIIFIKPYCLVNLFTTNAQYRWVWSTIVRILFTNGRWSDGIYMAQCTFFLEQDPVKIKYNKIC